jgi:DNA polymerase
MTSEKDVCIKDCEKCPALVESRTQIVNGVGPADTELILVGEAPGKNEDKNGEPFVGRSGTVLDDELEKNGVSRGDIRITNTVRCRPPENRDPHKSERENCFTYLEREISEIEPEVVLTLGRIPTTILLGDDDISVTQVSGNLYNRFYNGTMVKVVAGMHPASTLYDPSYKELFEDAVEVAVKNAFDS